MKVMILGCGPAGLMAAQGVEDACRREGVKPNIQIISRKQPSALYGAQYLHKPIPGISVDSTRITYQLRGHADDYRVKIYGDTWNGTVSPEDLLAEHTAWDIRHTYKRLWAMWQDAITNVELKPYAVRQLLDVGGFDLVINSVPRPALCAVGHAFGQTEIWAAGDAPDLGINLGNMYQCPDNMVVCNGEESPLWYRMSRVFKHTTIEWPGWVRSVPVMTAARVVKPTATDCDCFPTIKHVGRYGTWKKGVLSHTAYSDARKYAEHVMGVSRVAAAQAEA